MSHIYFLRGTAHEKPIGKMEEKTMSRASMVTLGVIFLAVILGIGYYATYQPTGELRTECSASFSRLDAKTDDMKLDYGEFAAYREGLSPDDFGRADTDKNQALTLQEFCNWEGTITGRG
jgi:hypothetical protein